MSIVRIGCFKFLSEPITLKSGRKSNFYADLRELIKHPAILNQLAINISKIIKNNYTNLNNIVIAGLPYGAIPLATLVSVELGIPQLIIRKERKNYGTKKMIEGLPSTKKKCILIDDVITSGTSISEVLELFKEYSDVIEIDGVIVVLDREEPKVESLPKLLPIHSVFRLTDIKELTSNLPFKGRLEIESMNNITRKVLETAHEKRSNLIVAVDVTDPFYAIEIIDEIGKSVCVIKLHYDIFNFWTNHSYKEWDQFREELTRLKRRDGWILFEDRKFSDIGKTVYHQYQEVQRRYSREMDLTNAFLTCGRGTVEALYDAENAFNGNEINTGLLLIAQLSSKGNLLKDSNANLELCVELAHEFTDYVCGFICQSKFADNIDDVIYCTPGVHLGKKSPISSLDGELTIQLDQKGDELNQSYRTVQEAIVRDNCDFIIVGRGVCKAKDVKEAAERYRQEGWKALCSK